MLQEQDKDELEEGHESTGSLLTLVIALLFVTIVMAFLFFKILFF